MSIWRPIKEAPHEEPFLARDDDWRLAVMIVCDEPAVSETTKRWPWSKPVTRTAEPCSCIYYLLPSAVEGVGYHRLVKRADDLWGPTMWAAIKDLADD